MLSDEHQATSHVVGWQHALRCKLLLLRRSHLVNKPGDSRTQHFSHRQAGVTCFQYQTMPSQEHLWVGCTFIPPSGV